MNSGTLNTRTQGIGSRRSAVPVDLADLGVVLGPDDLVAAHASLDRGHARELRAPRVGVAELAVDLVRAGVDQVAEEDRLARRPGHRHDRPADRRP